MLSLSSYSTNNKPLRGRLVHHIFTWVEVSTQYGISESAMPFLIAPSE